MWMKGAANSSFNIRLSTAFTPTSLRGCELVDCQLRSWRQCDTESARPRCACIHFYQRLLSIDIWNNFRSTWARYTRYYNKQIKIKATKHKHKIHNNNILFLFRPFLLDSDDKECTTNANPLHLCATMLPFLAKYDRDDLRSRTVHRKVLPSKEKFSVFCIDRTHRCGTLSVD